MTRRDTWLAVARRVAAVLLAGILGAAAWLIVAQESVKQGYTSHGVNDGMGVLLGGEGEDMRRLGLLGTAVAGVALALLHGLAARYPPRHWARRGVVTGVVLFLVWGLVFGPLVAGSAVDVPAGLFGREGGAGTVPCIAVASLTAGMVIARIHDLVAGRDWWERKHFDLRESMREIFSE